MKLRPIPWSRMTAEFLVVFLGVSLSLIADDWRQNHDSRAAERSALEEIMADLRADSGLLVRATSSLGRADRSAIWIRRHLDDASVEPDTALFHMRRLGFGTIFAPTTVAYTGLKESGGLALLRDEEIRRQLVEYYDVRLVGLGELSDKVQERTGEYIDVLFDHTLTPLAETATTNWVRQGLFFTSSWDAFRSDPRLERSVAYLGLTAGNWLTSVIPVVAQNSEVREAIDTYLSR